MVVAVPVEDRVRALQESMDEATKRVNDWSESKRESADVTIQTRSLASYYESQLEPKRNAVKEASAKDDVDIANEK